ncbi:MAG: ATP-binding protein [Candidatus Sedimenticola sp. (ex Thyasira tokunagai)]
MIIDFSVSNFRSIKDEVVLSAHAETTGTRLLENISFPSEKKIGVLKVVGIYGANASGKSNLLNAFKALRYMVAESGSLKENIQVPYYEPFVLDQATSIAPISFEIEFTLPKGNRYRYHITYTENRILEEGLSYYPSSQPALIFDRKEKDTWKTIRFGSSYKGGKKRLSFFENNSYLSKAGNSADAPEMIRDVYSYLTSGIFILGINQNAVKIDWHKDDDLLQKVNKLLSFVDTGIDGIQFVEDDSDAKADIVIPDRFPEEIKNALIKQHKKKAFFSHKTSGENETYFEEKMESAGTIKLYRLAPILIDALKYGYTLILDELDNSMHPFIGELIVKLFNDPRVNKSNAQLIFSTHNINLMSPDNFRRDQVWFTEKKDGVSTLYSLDDFDKNKVKPSSPFGQWYIEGRFDAIPRINYQGILSIFDEKVGIDA